MYNSLFCRLYNEFGWNEYPRVFAEQLLTWLHRRGLRISEAIDLGCGTGVLCEVLAARGVNTLGVDLSEAMIDIALKRSPGLRYAVGNMVDFRAERPVDLVTCTGDAINHIFDLDDVSRVFANVHASLRPGGLFIFDLLRYDEVPRGEPFEVDYDGLRVRFKAELDDTGHSRLHIDALEGDAVRFSEMIDEKVHDLDAILARLNSAGFEVLQCSDRLLPDSETGGTTWFIVACKPMSA